MSEDLADYLTCGVLTGDGERCGDAAHKCYNADLGRLVGEVWACLPHSEILDDGMADYCPNCLAGRCNHPMDCRNVTCPCPGKQIAARETVEQGDSHA